MFDLVGALTAPSPYVTFGADPVPPPVAPPPIPTLIYHVPDQGGVTDLSWWQGGASILGGLGNDLIVGAQGVDIMFGGAGNDFLFGGPTHNIILGGDGNDFIYAVLGKGNLLDGGAGNDTIVAAASEPGTFIEGGTGADVIMINVGAADGSVNLLDFHPYRDGDTVVLTNIAPGSQFYFAPNEELIYDPATGHTVDIFGIGPDIMPGPVPPPVPVPVPPPVPVPGTKGEVVADPSIDHGLFANDGHPALVGHGVDHGWLPLAA